jgi:hypothetical protein
MNDVDDIIRDDLLAPTSEDVEWEMQSNARFAKVIDHLPGPAATPQAMQPVSMPLCQGCRHHERDSLQPG